MIRIYKGASARHRFSEVRQFFIGVISPFAGPRPPALLQDPEPHHVLQETCLTPEAPLVGKVGVHTLGRYGGFR